MFLGRWVAFFRAVMPALAGSSPMTYRTFLTFNALGGMLWGSVVVTAGYLAGASYQKVETVFGRDAAIIIAVAVVVGLVVWHFRRRANADDADDADDTGATGDAGVAGQTADASPQRPGPAVSDR